MLDDLTKLSQIDKYDAFGTVSNQWQQLTYEFKIINPKPNSGMLNIVHSGMGGSALWATLSTCWPGYKVPFEVVKGYDIPAYVGEKTIFIASSYSGNTEETLSAIEKAEEKGAYIAVITSGGKLEERAREKGHTLLVLPKIIPPRYGVFYGLNAIVTLCESLGLVNEENALSQLRTAADFSKASTEDWLITTHTSKNLAKQTAQEMMGKSAVIYSGQLLSGSAHTWKISFNENAKNVAWEYVFPEFNHNEFTGWTSHPIEKPYGVVYLLSSFEHERIQRRLELSEKFLSGRWPSPHKIEVQGDTPLKQVLWSVTLGYFVSLYLSVLNGLSPIDMPEDDIIEKFKKELG